ncbi:VWA domain-containing protein, partial [Bacteroidota bacterium]
MKTFNSSRLFNLLLLTFIAIVYTPQLNAQGDILDLYDGSGETNCEYRGQPVSGYSPVIITVNYDNNGPDTLVIIENILGRREIEDVGDNTYQFCGPNSHMCSFSTAGDGEFRIKFQCPPGNAIGIDTISFDITESAGDGFEVNTYKGGALQTAQSYNLSGTQTLPVGLKDCSTKIDTIVIIAKHDDDIGNPGNPTPLFELNNLVIHYEPTVKAGSNSPICGGDDLELTESADSAESWSWSGPGFSGTVSGKDQTIASATSAAAGRYYVTATDASGCSKIDSVDVIVNVGPSASVISGGGEICNGESINLIVTITGGTSPYTVVLSDGTTVNDYINGSDINVSPTTGTDYTLTSVTDDNNCPSSNLSGTASVTVHNGPSASVLIGGGPICVDSSIDLTVNITGGTSQYTVVLNDGTADISFTNYISGSDITISPTADVDYTIFSVTDDNNCPSSDITGTASVTIHPCPSEVVCVIDLSGSMTSDFYNDYSKPYEEWRLAYAKVALKAFADLLNENSTDDDVNYGLASFKKVSGQCKAFKDYDIVPLNGTTGILNTITGLSAGGKTPLLAGLDTAKNMFTTPDMNSRKAIVLLSDGDHNCPSSANIMSSSVYDELMGQIDEKNISVYSIAFGQSGEVNIPLLQNIASGTENGFHDVTVDVASKPAADPDATVEDWEDLLYPDILDNEWNPNTALCATYSNILTNTLGMDYSEDPMGIISQGVTQQFNIPVSGLESKICFFISWVTSQTNYLGVKIKTSNNIE